MFISFGMYNKDAYRLALVRLPTEKSAGPLRVEDSQLCSLEPDKSAIQDGTRQIANSNDE